MNLCQKVECPYGGWSQDKVVLEDYIICGDLVRYLVDKSASNVKERLDALEGDLDQWRDARVRAELCRRNPGSLARRRGRELHSEVVAERIGRHRRGC